MTGIHVEGVTDDSTLLKHYLSRLGDNPATNRARDSPLPSFFEPTGDQG
jgi:hypothetical protein